MRWTLWRNRRMRAKRTAKSCGPDIPTLISGATRERCHPRRHKSPVSGASTKETVKTIAQGRPDRSGEPVVTYSYAFYFCIRGCGCIRRPAFPAPSMGVGPFTQELGRITPRECGSLPGAARRDGAFLEPSRLATIEILECSNPREDDGT